MELEDGKEDKEMIKFIEVPSFTTRNNNLKENINISSSETQDKELNALKNLNNNLPLNANTLLKSVEISLCYNEILKCPENAEELFLKHIIKKEDFYKDPWKILNNSNLLLCYEEKLYTYKTAVPFLFSYLIYGEEIPASTINELNSSKGMFGFLRSNKNQNQLSKIKVHHDQENDTLNTFNLSNGLQD